MPTIQQDYSEQETKKLIADAAAAKDSFRVRVMRRRPGGGTDVVASFEEGNAEQIAFAEKWLPELAGGGNFLVQAFHESAPMTQIGGSIPLTIDGAQPRNVDFDIVNSPAWTGPRGLSYPKRQPTRPANGTMHADGGAGAEAIGMQQPVGGATPLGGVRTANDPAVEALARAQRAEQNLEAERTRNQIEAIKTAHSQAVKTLEVQVQTLVAELREERARQSNASPKESSIEALSKIAAPFIPLLQTMLQGQNEMKVKMMELEAKNAQATLDAARMQSESLNKILTTMLDSRGKIDPMVQLMFDQLKEVKHGESPLTSMQGALQLITAARDAGFGDREGGGAGEVAIEIARAASAALEAYMASKSGQPGQPAAQVTMPMTPQRLPQPGARRPATPFERLDRMIKSHHNVAETANFFLDGLTSDPEIRQRFQAAGQEVEAFFKANWAQWAMAAIEQHGPYVMALNDAVLAAARQRGMVGGAPAQQPQQPPAQQPRPQQPQAQPSVQQAVEAMRREPEPEPEPGDEQEEPGEEEPIDEEEAATQ